MDGDFVIELNLNKSVMSMSWFMTSIKSMGAHGCRDQ
jgi:hypothetical protein